MIYLLLTLATMEYQATHFEFDNFSLGKDKIAHIAIGAGVGEITNEWLRNDNLRWKDRLMITTFIGFIAGYAIEGYDIRQGGYADGYDWIATGLGATIGFFIGEWIYNRNREPDIEQRTNRAIKKCRCGRRSNAMVKR